MKTGMEKTACSGKYGRLFPRTLLFLFLTVILFSGCTPEWYDDAWAFRRVVDIGNPCGEDLQGWETRVVLESPFDFSRARADGSDLRVTERDGVTLVPFWIEHWDSSSGRAVVWMRVPGIPQVGTRVYLYYGNPEAVDISNGTDTFEAYDGFESCEAGTPPLGAVDNPGEWAGYTGNPLITQGPSGEWDDHGATFASAIWDEAVGEFRMYYHGFSFSGVHQIGLSVSPDGLNWSKYDGNPVLTPGPEDWDAGSVRVPMVWKEGPEDYRMIYSGVGSGGLQVGHATSTDGIVWIKHPANPVFNDPTWATGQTENWGVMKVDDQYLMWYSDFGMRQAGIAVSTDLVNWAPHQTGPVLASTGIPEDLRYSQFCPFSFTYGGNYYVLVPSYDSGGNYARFYLYRSSSPFFPETDRHLVRVAHTVGPDGEWDDHDSDTPFVLTLDIERSIFYNDQLWVYYAAEGGSNLWKEGLLIETDMEEALSDAALPDENFFWSTAGDVSVVEYPVRSGQQSARQRDLETGGVTTLTGLFGQRSHGVVGAWMQRSAVSDGDYDIYLYGGSNLSCVAGLGRDGDFHYWDGDFQPTGVTWSVDTWYLVTLAFDAEAGVYDFVVYDESLEETVRVEGIAFGNLASHIDRAMLYTSVGFQEDAFTDDFRLRNGCGADPDVVVGEEEAGSGG